MKIAVAGCVLVDDYGRILLLHRDSERRTWWELPGGKVEEDEMPEQAAVREMSEELGVTVELIKKLGETDFDSDDDEIHFTWFQAKTSQQPHIQEPELFDDVDYFDTEDLMSLALSDNMIILLDKILSGEVALI